MVEGLEEAIERILEKRIDLIERVILRHPEIIYEAIAKLTPWRELATKKDIEALRAEITDIKDTMVTKKDFEKELSTIRSTMATKDDLKAVKEGLEKAVSDVRSVMATKDDLKAMATKEDLRKLETRLTNMISALGARWGIMSETAYREGLKEILTEIGWRVEHLVITDVDGYVYGRPEEVEIDIVIADNRIYLVELTSAIKRTDLDLIVRKAELYRKVKGVKPDRIILISPFIHDKNPERIKAIASEMGVEIIYPAPSE
ncbi:MAG: hypothetical protein DJ555_02225 [Desulfurococcaceae archaeon]|nr:MAG: hypothetical protein DJ555_02225 [Desulfurococcaceae archaeon]